MTNGNSFEDMMAGLANFGMQPLPDEEDKVSNSELNEADEEVSIEDAQPLDPFASFFSNSDDEYVIADDEDDNAHSVDTIDPFATYDTGGSLPSLDPIETVLDTEGEIYDSVDEVNYDDEAHSEDPQSDLEIETEGDYPQNDMNEFSDFLSDLNSNDVDEAPEFSALEVDAQQEDVADGKAVHIADDDFIEKNEEETASNTAVTPDGYTLEDMLRHRRGGRVTIDKEIQEYKDGVRKVIANGVEKEDSLNVKHVLDVEEENRKIEGRIKASKSFVQRNTKYTEEEKIMMKRLGITHVEFTEMMKPESGLTTKDKERIIAMGGKGSDRHFKGKRFRATVADRDIIQFLAKFKFANARILSRLRDEPISRTWRKLQRLKKGGLVADSEVIGMGTIWYLSNAGMAFSGYSFQPYRRRSGKTSQMPPTIGANHVAACLWNNTINILCEEEFPQENREIPTRGELSMVKGETLISELELRSSLGREANPAFGGQRDGVDGGQYAMVAEQAQAIWHEWNRNGRSEESPEMDIGNEYLWVLYPTSGYTKSFHVPDLVVRRPRDADGTPRSIAVEIELNQKSYERYMETLMAYKIDDHIYEKVVWVTTSSSIMRVLTEIADKIGLEGFDVVPMVNEDGIYRNPDIWHI